MRAKLIDSEIAMRRAVAAAMVLASLPAGALHAAERACLEGASEAHAVAAADARSLTLRDGRILRVAGIEPFDLLRPDLADAEAALQRRLAEFALGQPLSIQLATDAPDRYGRHPALIAAGGALIQEALAREGLAIAFAGGDPLPCFRRILAAEADARDAGRGFWPGAPLPGADPYALAAQIGHFTIFEGTVLSVGNRSTRTYLNFGQRWSEDVTVEIAAGDRKAFGGEDGLAALAGETVRVRGFLEDKAGPMMALTSAMQLERLGAGGGEMRGEP